MLTEHDVSRFPGLMSESVEAAKHYKGVGGIADFGLRTSDLGKYQGMTEVLTHGCFGNIDSLIEGLPGTGQIAGFSLLSGYANDGVREQIQIAGEAMSNLEGSRKVAPFGMK